MIQRVKILLQLYSSQLLYLIFGVVTTIVNILVFAIGIRLGMGTTISNIIAWFLSVLVAYLTNRVWVFDSHAQGFKALATEVSVFFFYRIVTLGVDIAIVDFGVKILHGNPILWKIIDNVVVIILNYIFSKVFIFKNKKGRL